jgi:hypothetical protein
MLRAVEVHVEALMIEWNRNHVEKSLEYDIPIESVLTESKSFSNETVLNSGSV